MLRIVMLFTFTAVLQSSAAMGAEPETIPVREETEEIVVTATRTSEPLSHIGSSISTISAKQIEQRQWRTVADALESVPGVVMHRAGGPGSTTTIFLRGSPNKHVVVLIDGIETSDVSSPNRGPVLANINTDSVERIEILRGNQSTLYGSESIGGVINIITKKGKHDSVSIFSEAGSFNTVKGGADFSVGTEAVRFTGGFTKMRTDGISAAREWNGNEEEDEYENLTLHGRFDIQPSELLSIKLLARYVDSEVELDDFENGSLTDDLNSSASKDDTYLRAETTLKLFDNRWEQILGVGFTRHQRNFMNLSDDTAANTLPEEDDVFVGSHIKFDWQHNLTFVPLNTITIGFEAERELFDHETNRTQSVTNPEVYCFDARTDTVYIQDQIALSDCWFTTLGARRDLHEVFGGKNTYHASTALNIEKTGTKLKASYGTGYKTPSLYELFGFTSWDPVDGKVGNPDLTPETSWSWDVGFEQTLFGERLKFGSTWFRSHARDMITWQSNSATWDSWYENTSGVRSCGLESELSVQILNNLQLDYQHTYTKTYDEQREKYIRYQPRHHHSGSITWLFDEKKGQLTFSARHVGQSYRDTANRETMDEYTLFNMSTSYKLNDYWKIYGRVDNIFNQRYEENNDYGVAGLGAFLGLRVSF